MRRALTPLENGVRRYIPCGTRCLTLLKGLPERLEGDALAGIAKVTSNDMKMSRRPKRLNPTPNRGENPMVARSS